VLLLAKDLGASSAHVLFALDDEVESLSRVGFHRRATHQYHFRNPGWNDFDAFTASLRSEVRKQLKKERRRVGEAGLDISLVRGDAASLDEWRTMDALYRSTSGRKWGSPYLTKRFFEDARTTIGESALLCFARREGAIIAGTLSFTSSDAVFGRYWGATTDVDGLHFELCYYRLIDHALANGMTLVEAGAQGEHKVKRGYLPVVTHSAHALLHPGLDDAIGRFLAKERASVAAQIDGWAKEGPFRDDAIPRFPLRAGVPLVRG
jgi:predicted N-acyltransferase